MDASIYIALSRQINQFQNMDITANNIANANTTGYNAQKLVFNQYLVKDGKNGAQDAYADAPSTYRDMTGGSVQVTNNPFDLAISGPGYFQLQTPLGPRYTKSGNFQLDVNGSLVNASGYTVLGADGTPVTVPPGTKNVEINAIGQVSADGQAVGQVGLYEFADQQALSRLGNTLYDSKTPGTPAVTARIVQGAIESSNVNSVSELVKVMDISRSVGDTAKFIDAMYDLEQKGSATLSRAKMS